MPRKPAKMTNRIIGIVIIVMVLVGAFTGIKFLMKQKSKPEAQKGTDKIQVPLNDSKH